MTGGIGKSFCEDSNRKTMRKLLSHKGSMKRTTFDFVD